MNCRLCQRATWVMETGKCLDCAYPHHNKRETLSPQVRELLDQCAKAREEAKSEVTPIILDRQQAEMLSAHLNGHSFAEYLTDRGASKQQMDKWKELAKKVERQVWDLDDDGEPVYRTVHKST